MPRSKNVEAELETLVKKVGDIIGGNKPVTVHKPGRTEKIVIRCTPAEAVAYRKLAQCLGVDLSKIVRAMLLRLYRDTGAGK